MPNVPMQEGNHEVRTAWGFLAVKLPMPDDEQWAKDRVTILQALGVLDLDGNPTPLLEVVKAADLARLTQEDWEEKEIKCWKPVTHVIREILQGLSLKRVTI